MQKEVWRGNGGSRDAQDCAWEDSRNVFAKSDSLQDVSTISWDVEHSDCIPGSMGESGTSFEAADSDSKESDV